MFQNARAGIPPGLGIRRSVDRAGGDGLAQFLGRSFINAPIRPARLANRSQGFLPTATAASCFGDGVLRYKRALAYHSRHARSSVGG